jgi:hypothetical protein
MDNRYVTKIKQAWGQCGFLGRNDDPCCKVTLLTDDRCQLFGKFLCLS